MSPSRSRCLFALLAMSAVTVPLVSANREPRAEPVVCAEAASVPERLIVPLLIRLAFATAALFVNVSDEPNKEPPSMVNVVVVEPFNETAPVRVPIEPRLPVNVKVPALIAVVPE